MKVIITRAASAVVGAIALLVLVGWAADIELLKRVHPTYVAMNPATAVALILASISLWLLTTHEKESTRIVEIAAAAAVASIGVLKLVEIMWGVHIGVDVVLFPSKLAGGLNAVPNRIAPNTAVNLALLGAALILVRAARGALWAQLLTVVSLLLSSVAILGYVYNIVNLYGLPNFIPMGIHTAGSFVMLGIGVLAVRPNEGILKFFGANGGLYHTFQNLRLKSKLLAGFGVLVGLSFILGGLTYFNVAGIQDDFLPVRTNVKNATSSLLAMKAAEKNFLARDIRGGDDFEFFKTGTSDNLMIWNREYEGFNTSISKVIAYQENHNPAKIKELEEVRRNILSYHDAFLQIVEKYKEKGFDEYGLEGEMKLEALALETAMEGNTTALTQLLLARRSEKDFLLRPNVGSVTDFDREIITLLSLGASNQAYIKRINNYQKAFHAIVNLQKDIGVTQELGLSKTMSRSIAAIDPILLRHEQEIYNETDATIGFIKRLIVSLLVFFTILSSILASFVSREVINQISSVQKAAENIAHGNFHERIQAPAKDEVGVLATTFNTMAQTLEDTYRKLDTQNASLATKIKELEDTKGAMLHLLRDLNVEKVQLHEASLRSEAMIQSIGDGLIITDEYARITKVNKQTERLLGFTQAELVGKWIVEAVRAVDRNGQIVPPAKYPLSEALMTGQAVTLATSYVRKNQTTFPVAVTAAPVMLADAPIGAVVAFRDITREKELERLKDEFVSVASHELRTPMTAIRGLVSMILEGDYGAVNDNLKGPLYDITNSTQRLIHLVSDMLNVSRIEAGRLKFTLKDFDIKKIIDETVNILQPIAHQKGIVIQAAQFGSALICADIDKVKQVLNNLIGNSLKFTDRGGITVSTRQEGDLLKIYIQDTGTGLSHDDQGKLFGKFQQISSMQGGRPPGTGLGLYISRELVRRMGGDMWIEHSEVGKGSIFAFSVPIANSILAQKIKADVEKEEQFHPDQKAMN